MKIAIKSCFTTLVEDTTLIQNAATPYPVEFAFSKDWDGFAKTALFEAGGVSMAVVLSEDKCDIPGECLKKGGIPLKIAIYGVKGEERKSTGWHVTSKILFTDPERSDALSGRIRLQQGLGRVRKDCAL